MKRAIAILLTALSLFTLVACSEKTEDHAFKAGDTELGIEAFYSEMYTSKNEFLFNYLQVEKDDPAIWTQDSPSGKGETMGDTITRMVVENMVQFAWVIEYAKDNGVTFTEEDNKSIETALQNLKDGFETEEEYKEYLEKLKFTEETIKKHLEDTLYYDKGFRLLVGENGLYAVSQEQYDSYYNDNFYTVKHIFINDLSKEGEDGEYVLLNEEEKAEQTAKAEQIYADLQNGTDFETLYMLSEDNMAALYPDGLTFEEGMIGSVYETAVKGLEAGEYTKVTDPNGGIYIIKRLELSQTDREEYESYVQSMVHSDIQTKIYNDHKDEVTVNYDLINQYPIKDVPAA